MQPLSEGCIISVVSCIDMDRILVTVKLLYKRLNVVVEL